MSSEQDDFWDLDKLLPGKGRKASPPPPQPVATVEVQSGQDAPSSEEGKLHFKTRIREQPPEETYSYAPQDNPLIASVTVIRRSAAFSYYHQFRIQAERYLEVPGEECPYVPFFSYVPQYQHLEDAQRKYYFYWRQCVREGKYLPCDISYLLLYFYEIINLPHKIPPEKGALLLASCWAAYQEKLPKLNPYMSQWLADYCLVHRVPCPNEVVRPFLPRILSVSTMKEFYLGSSADLSECKVDALLSLASDYNWRVGRYATGEYAPLFEKHLRGAASVVLRSLLESGEERTPYEKVTKQYEAFCGSLCAQNVKCSLRVEYYPISHTESLRRILTATVKYAENCLRSSLAIKSRLSVPPLPEKYRALVDAYFRAALPKAQKQKEPPPAYMRQYDAPQGPVSFARAADIELASWEVTRCLVGEDTEEEPAAGQPEESVAPPAEAEAPKSGAQPAEGPMGLSGRQLAFLRGCLTEDAAVQRAEAAAEGQSVKSMGDRINELVYDAFGDVVLQEAECGFAVIPDYQEEVTQWTQM